MAASAMLLIGLASPLKFAPTAASECGPDQGVALQSALAQLPAEPSTGAPWAPEAVDSNYDACADLSAIIVSIYRGTVSSPEQALMFHRGQYLGTGTSKAYGFTSIDQAASTDDTVVLRYKDARGAACNACAGPVTSVRYQWQSDRVVMLDPPPPW